MLIENAPMHEHMKERRKQTQEISTQLHSKHPRKSESPGQNVLL